MRCTFVKCRAVLTEVMDRLGRLSWRCPSCERRRAGLCRHCPRRVDGRVGTAFYCAGCRRLATRRSVMRWQRCNPTHVAKKARERRWKKKGMRPPKEPMTYAERGRLGGKLGQAARQAKLGPERVAEIARLAREARWAKHRARQAQQQQAKQPPSPGGE